MKRTPKKPPKPATAAEVAAEERQRMISSDLEQIRRYIGEIARLNADRSREIDRMTADNSVLRAHLAAAHRSMLAPKTALSNSYPSPTLVQTPAQSGADCRNEFRANHPSEGQAAAQLLRPQDFATELPADD